MSENHVASATVEVPASAETVWDTLVDPNATWMLGALRDAVAADAESGSSS